MGTKDSLLELERELWNADEAFYRETLTPDAVMVFPEPTGVLEHDEILHSLGGADRWRSIDFHDDRLVELTPGVVQLIYRAAAERSEDGSEYQAWVTTTYVQKHGSWRLAAHQQTPVAE
jgi:hypothetical protein